MQLKYTTRKGAVNGQPSYLHIGRSGRTYRTLVQSKIDNPANAIDAPVKRPPVTPPVVAPVTETNNVFFYMIVALILLIMIYLAKK